MRPIELKKMTLPNGKEVNFYTVTRIGSGQYVKVDVKGLLKKHFIAAFTMEEFSAMYEDAIKWGFKMAHDNPQMQDLQITKQEEQKV